MEHADNTMSSQGDFITEITKAVRENPVPAALIGMGVLWLFAGGHKTSLMGGSQSLFGAVKTGVGTAASAGYRGTGYVGSAVAGGVQGAAGLVGQGASQLADAARAAGSAVGGVVNSAASATSDLGASAGGMASQMTDDTYNAGREWTNNLQSTLGDTFARQPLLLGAIGLGIGAAIAAAAPQTDAENRLMGGTSDAFKDQAQAVMSEKTQQAKDMAERVMAEAQSQGLNLEGAGQALRGAAKTAVDIAEKTISGKAVPLSPA